MPGCTDTIASLLRGLSMASELVPAYAYATITLVWMVTVFKLAVIPQVVTYDGI